MRICISTSFRRMPRAPSVRARRRGVERAGTLALALLLCVAACDDEEPSNGAPSGPGVGGLDASMQPIATGDAAIDASGGALSGGASDARAPMVLDASVGPVGTPDGGTAIGADAAAPADAGSGEGGTAAGGACTRESLVATVNSYFSALSTRSHASLAVAPMVKFTEDGQQLALGEGLWQTAGEVRFKRSAYDVQQCETVTESVVANGGEDFIVGVRLKLMNGLISEIETILVGPGGFVANAPGVIASASEDWEMVLPEAERSTREFIKEEVIDAYFIDLFAGDVAPADFPFASTCRRAENGTSPGACTFGIPALGAMQPVHYVIDVEAGIGVGFVLFGGGTRGFLDFHMFRIRSGQVHGVRAVVGPSVSSRGWP